MRADTFFGQTAKCGWGLSGRGHSATLARARRIVAVLALLWLAGISPGVAQDYVLGPQDILKIRVFEWRPSSGTAFEWVPLTGDFVISSAGNLSLPIIGTVPAAGQTLEEVSETIGERLQSQIGLQIRPSASVEVSTYRPFFVTGMVTTPGKYNFIPGLTVVQALSMAGGIGPVDPNVIGLQRDALSGRGDLRALDAERLGLVARQARVDAILKEAQSVTFPPELSDAEAGHPNIARMMREERSLFATRQQSIKTEIDALNQAKVLATNQIEALKSKAASLARQIELANKDLESVQKLAQRGLTLSTRQLNANQTVADLESRNLDVALAILKTRLDLAKVDKDIADVQNRYRLAALTESAELRDRFEANAAKAQTARALLRNLEVRAPAAVAAADENGEPATFMTTIDRVVDRRMQSLLVRDNDLVAPGDVIRVERQDPAVPAMRQSTPPVSATNGNTPTASR